VTRLLAAAVGLGCGYLVWLACVSLLPLVVPVHQWVVAALIVLAVVVAVAIVSARRSRPVLATAFWCAPVGPIVATAYSLVVLLT
jgi:hypothetical protein